MIIWLNNLFEFSHYYVVLLFSNHFNRIFTKHRFNWIIVFAKSVIYTNFINFELQKYSFFSFKLLTQLANNFESIINKHVTAFSRVLTLFDFCRMAFKNGPEEMNQFINLHQIEKYRKIDACRLF